MLNASKKLNEITKRLKFSGLTSFKIKIKILLKLVILAQMTQWKYFRKVKLNGGLIGLHIWVAYIPGWGGSYIREAY